MATSSPLGSTARTNELLSAASKQTGISAPTFSESPTQVSNAVSSSMGNAVVNGMVNGKAAAPEDLPGFTPTSKPVNTSQPQPDSAQAQINPSSTAPQALVDQVNKAQGQVNSLVQNKNLQPGANGTYSAVPTSDQYKQAHEALNQSGVETPNGAGAGSAGAQSALGTVAPPPPQGNPMAVDNFYTANPNVKSGVDELMKVLSPQETSTQLQEAIDQLASDRTELQGLRTEYMNNDRIMGGTEQDIRDEVTKAGGFATNSQVLALSMARNKTLLARNGQLANLIQSQQDAINTDTTLMTNEKDLANTQFNQRMSILNYYQQNQQNMLNAGRDMYKTLMSSNAQGLYNALQTDPQQLARFESITGLTPDALKGMASQQQMDNQIKQATLAHTLAETAHINSEGNAGIPGTVGYDKNQQKLEKDYSGILVKEISSRSGTLGTEDAKVVQANHMASLVNQYYDPKSGNYNIPKAQYGELVLGLAGMLSKTGTPTDSQVDNINQLTAKGKINEAISYVTGTPINGSTQAVIKNLVDSIDRQAQTAVQNREAGLNVLRGLAPTDLESSRRQALEKNTLAPYSGIKRGVQSQTQPLKSGDGGTLSSGITWKIVP